MTEDIPFLAAASIMGIPAFAHALLADTTVQAPEWVGSLTQISAFGLVAWIVYYMFTKWLPAIQAAHAEQLDEQRKSHTHAMEVIANAHADAVKALTVSFSDALKTQRLDLIHAYQPKSE